MRGRSLVVLTVAVLCLGATQANAGVAISDVTTIGWERGRRATSGWQFVPTTSINVTHLGLWDDMFAADVLGSGETTVGFTYEVPIGIWRVSDEALLSSTTLGPGTIDPVIDEFRYAEIAPLALSAGEIYAIGYQYADSTPLSELAQTPRPGDFQVDPAIILGMHVRSPDPGFRFPGSGNTTNFPNTHFGPNFQFDVISDSGTPDGPDTPPDVIPAPGALLLGSIGAGVVSWLRRRRTI